MTVSLPSVTRRFDHSDVDVCRRLGPRHYHSSRSNVTSRAVGRCRRRCSLTVSRRLLSPVRVTVNTAPWPTAGANRLPRRRIVAVMSPRGLSVSMLVKVTVWAIADVRLAGSRIALGQRHVRPTPPPAPYPDCPPGPMVCASPLMNAVSALGVTVMARHRRRRSLRLLPVRVVVTWEGALSVCAAERLGLARGPSPAHAAATPECRWCVDGQPCRRAVNLRRERVPLGAVRGRLARPFPAHGEGVAARPPVRSAPDRVKPTLPPVGAVVTPPRQGESWTSLSRNVSYPSAALDWMPPCRRGPGRVA